MNVSIIICVYNKEAYLDKCISRILNQTYKKLEIIIIDDGSTDNTLSICKSYEKKDKRISVYTQKNKGIGYTRHRGIKLATGDYIIHSDPDDWIEYNMIELLLKKAIEENSDITICDFFIENHNGDVINQSIQNPLTTEGIQLQKKIVSGKIHGGLWNKLISKHLYENKIVWPKELSFCEDQLILLQILQKNPSIAYINYSLYHYIQHENSLTNNIQSDFIKKNIKPYLRLLKKIYTKHDIMIYYTSCLFFTSYLISIKKFRKREIYSLNFISHFYLYKSYLDNDLKDRLYAYFTKFEKLIIKLFKK
ncbi:glycosyltransferase family 2 protein [Empedobacter falsenii]